MHGYHSSKTIDSRPTATTKTGPSATSKWVINLSSKPLTTAQEQLLIHRPNFTVTPRSPPIGECIAAIERICQNMEQGEADELRAEVWVVMKKSQLPRHNITREEQKALRELKKDNTRVVLTADKGVCMVVLDREEHIKKAGELLHQNTYKIIPADLTTKQKNKLITLLKKIKQEGGIKEETYKETVSHRYWHSKVLRVTKSAQGRGPTHTNCFK